MVTDTREVAVRASGSDNIRARTGAKLDELPLMSLGQPLGRRLAETSSAGGAEVMRIVGTWMLAKWSPMWRVWVSRD